MAPLTQPDPEREWSQAFTPVDDAVFAGRRGGSSECYAWVAQFYRLDWKDLLPYLESLPWPDPTSVQVLVRDEEDDCFGLWMLYDGELTEVPLPRTRRNPLPGDSVTGVLTRTDRGRPPLTDP